MAICFKCWKLVKITEVKPRKEYFNGWCRWGYEIKSEDLMKDHQDNSCFKAETATIAKNTMSSAPNFEPACISPTRQRNASASEIRNLWNDRSNMPNISSRTTLGDLAEAYFDSVRTNAGKKQTQPTLLFKNFEVDIFESFFSPYRSIDQGGLILYFFLRNDSYIICMHDRLVKLVKDAMHDLLILGQILESIIILIKYFSRSLERSMKRSWGFLIAR